jgi:membrane fusion protein, multidrug efflux system
MMNAYAHAALLALALLVAACTPLARSEPQKIETSKAAPARANVRVQVVASAQLTETIDLRGSTLPDHDVTLAAETPGRVEEIHVDLGDRVKAGDVLVRVDYAMLRAQRDHARAAYQLATKTHQRLVKLRADDLVAQQRVDEAVMQKESALASLNINKVQLDRSTVSAPLGGIVARRLVDQGEYVNPGQPLLQIVDYATVIVASQVPERLVAHVRRGMPVSVDVDALGRRFEGEVYVVIPAAHPTSHTYEVRVKVANPDYAILVGMSARVHIAIREHRDVVVVAQDLVVEAHGRRVVFVERGGVAQQREVVLGAIDGDRVMVLEGLAPGDRLIIEGHRDLVDGQLVEDVGAEAPPVSGAVTASDPRGDV